jgi:hypothetical protein
MMRNFLIYSLHLVSLGLLQRPFQKFMDWQQCAAVIPPCSSGTMPHQSTNFSSSPHISRRMRWVKFVRNKKYKILIKKPSFCSLGVDGRIILKWILRYRNSGAVSQR